MRAASIVPTINEGRLLRPRELGELLGVPVGTLANWRSARTVEHNGLWHPSWGQRPKSTSDAVDAARGLVATVPPLIPIYAHRMVPTDPQEAGNPVLSVMQSDIIYYGVDLLDWFERVPPLHDDQLGHADRRSTVAVLVLVPGGRRRRRSADLLHVSRRPRRG